MNIKNIATIESTSLFDELSQSDREVNQMKSKIASAIIKVRMERKMNQKELAKLLGVTQGMVSKLESGECNLTLSKINELCEKLDLKCIFEIKERTHEAHYPQVSDWTIKGDFHKPSMCSEGA